MQKTRESSFDLLEAWQNQQLQIATIAAAKRKISEHIAETSVRSLTWLSRLSGLDVVAKLEHQQPTGSFKIRGAAHRLVHNMTRAPIVAASAGNHALAISEVAARLNIPTTVVLPGSASPAKRNRIVGYGHKVLSLGASLEDATKHAHRLAVEREWDFISPFNDSLVILGQATLFLELFQQTGQIDAIIVPVGGGGLLAGVALAAQLISPHTKIIAVEPENYASFKTSIESKKVVRVANKPTLADGLAVNLDLNSITIPLVNKLVSDYITVSEEEIAAATKAILLHESMLVEPSGAVGLAALISGKFKTKGRIATIFTGGNISVSNLSSIMSHPFRDTKLYPFLNVTGEKIEHTAYPIGLPPQSISRLPSQRLSSQSKDYLKNRILTLEPVLKDNATKLHDYANYCLDEGIEPDRHSLDEASRITEELADEVKQTLLEIDSHPETLTAKASHEYLMRYRLMMHKLVVAQQSLEWRSASYSQSRFPQFFNMETQDYAGVNYNRYESSLLKPLEQSLSDTIGLDGSRYGLLATSSGMAAYTLIESYLLRYALQPNDTVLIPHYIYFETDEQISKVPYVHLERADLFKAEQILQKIDEIKPKVVFLDPMTNTPELRMADILGTLDGLASRERIEPMHIVIDGTMLGGGLRKAFELSIPKSVRLYYYESCSKYLQLGMDTSMAGLAAFPIDSLPCFDRLRRNTGTILYDMNALLFPSYQSYEHRNRMKCFTDNALLFSRLILQNHDVNSRIKICFPLLFDHPDRAVAEKYDSIGGVITFRFLDQKLNGRDALNSLIEIVIKNCHESQTALTKGVSFGFSLPRISAASAMAEMSEPFLRLSIGDQSEDEVRNLAKSFCASILEFCEANELLLSAA